MPRTMVLLLGVAALTGACATPLTIPDPPALAALDDEPVVEPADGEAYTNPGAVVEVDGTLHLLRNSFSQWPGASQVHLLTSTDRGLTWALPGGGPLLTNADVPYAEEDETVFVTSALVDADGTWVAYLYTYDGSLNRAVIGRAAAPEPGGPWTVDPDPVLEPGEAGGWDAVRLAEPSVVRTGDAWTMWFVGFATGQVAAIGRATSDDGITWTKDDAPVLRGDQDWTRGSVDGPQVVQAGDRYVMTHTTPSRGASGIGFATSTDGVDWAPAAANPLATRESVGEAFFQSELFRTGDQLRFLLEVGPGATATALHLYELTSAPPG